MDEYSYPMDEAGLCVHSRKEKRLQRMVHILIVAVLVQFLTTVILLVALGLHGQEPQHSQAMNPIDSQPPVNSPWQNQPTDLEHPSAMLTVPSGNKTHNEGEYLQWETALGIAHCHGGFSYSGGNLTVPRKGRYRIFLQITYSSECQDEEIHLKYTVSSVSESYNSDTPLLSAQETVSSCTTHWNKSVYTAGSFNLEANTILHVTSSYRELISKKENHVFFGAYLLS